MPDPLHIERVTSEIQGSKHTIELQSIRGLAALAVVLHHCTFYFNYDPSLKFVAEIVFNGHAAVICFFVLSGYVLTMSLNATPLTAVKLFTFYVRRAFRIYPALWFACILGIIYVFAFWHHPLSELTHEWWPPERRFFKITAISTIQTLLGISTPLAIPIWTLFIELVASLIIPLFAWTVARRKLLFVFITAALLVMAIADSNPISTSRYFIHFALGSWLTLIVPHLRDRRPAAWLVATGAAAGFGILWFGRLPFDARFLENYLAPIPALIEGVGAAIMIAAIHIRSDLFRFLRWPAAIWLGDISYSLYLLHLPVLGLVAGILLETLQLPVISQDPILATAAVLPLTVLLSSTAAAVSYRFVEVPGVKIGKQFSRWINSQAHRLPINYSRPPS